MILPPIHTDTEPTDAQIDDELRARPIPADEYISRSLARIRLVSRWKEADPDAFLQPFPCNDDEYRRYLHDEDQRFGHIRC